MKIIFIKKKIYAFILSILFSIIVSLTPWEALRGVEFYDRQNYINTIDYYDKLIHFLDFSSITNKIKNEWLWQMFLAFLNEDLGFGSTEIIFFITFLVTFLSSLLIISKFNLFSFVLLINPVFINFAVSQLRLAFAISLLIISLYLFKKKHIIFLPILIITLFIHSSAILFIFLFFVAVISHNIIKNAWVNFFLNTLAGVIIAVVSGPLMSGILRVFEDRRSEYTDMNSSVFYMSFWILLLLYFYFQYFFKKSEKTFEFYLSLSILTLVTIQTLTSGYPSRFLAACFPFVVVSMVNNKSKENMFLLFFYVSYSVIYWFYWIMYG